MNEVATLFADFNDKMRSERLYSSLRFLGGQREPTVGELVLVTDDDGNQCNAVVAEINGRIVELDPDWATFRPGFGAARQHSEINAG